MCVFPKNIFGRSVLHDIFSEITCLQNFRLEESVTGLYDFGVTKSEYVIIMKEYPISLKQWRKAHGSSWKKHLSIYLTIYK